MLSRAVPAVYVTLEGRFTLVEAVFTAQRHGYRGGRLLKASSDFTIVGCGVPPDGSQIYGLPFDGDFIGEISTDALSNPG